MSSPWTNAVKILLRRPTFLVVLVVLLAGAIGINAATSAMKLKFRKEALPLRSKEGLTALPQQMGTWLCVPGESQTVNPDLIHDLGTDQFVFRTYINTANTDAGGAATKEEVMALASLSDRERADRVMGMRNKNTNGVLTVAVTYYTGKVDTVPHVPERCYVADGFQPQNAGVQDWDLGQYALGVDRKVPVRFIDFEDQTSRGAQNRCVSYFFHANGKYEQDPEVVRIRLQNLLERYAYFAKIEVMTLLPNRVGATPNDEVKNRDRHSAAAAMQSFLTAALPEIEKLLPDWEHRAQ